MALGQARHKALSALLAERRRRVTEVDDTAVELIEDTSDTPEQMILVQGRSALPRSHVSGASRNHRPRLLSRKDRRLGRRNHPDVEEHGKDSRVLRPQAAGKAVVHASGLRSPHGASGGMIFAEYRPTGVIERMVRQLNGTLEDLFVRGVKSDVRRIATRIIVDLGRPLGIRLFPTQRSIARKDV
jgi:hypothetical protein